MNPHRTVGCLLGWWEDHLVWKPRSRFFHVVRSVAFLSLYLSLISISPAQDGALDSSFDPGRGAEYLPIMRSVIAQPDGRFFVFGDFDSLNGVPFSSIARFVNDDSLDTTFKPRTTDPPRFQGEIRAVALLPDGRLLVGGNLAIYGSTYSDYRSSLCRLNADGSVDLSFNNTFSSGVVNALGIQSDGKILVGGQFLTLQGTTNVVSLVRLTANGARDNSYPTRVAANGSVHFIQVLTNNTASTNSARIGGVLPEIGAARTNYLLSLKVDGTVESAYGGPAAVNAAVASRTWQADGKLLLAGFFTLANGASWNHVVRLNSDNTPDATFNIGSGADAEVLAVLVQSDGKIILAGGFTSFNGLPCGHIIRLNSDGSVDQAFNAGTGANDRIYQMQSHPNGGVIVLGAFNAFNGAPRAGIARLSGDGSVLASFAGLTPVSLVKPAIYAMTVQPGGKILIGGRFNAVRGRNLPGIARLNSDGTLDPSFRPGVGVDGQVQNIAIDSDGRILLAGMFTEVQGAVRTSLARLQPDGSLDLSFAPELLKLDGTAGSLSRVVALTNRQILAGGHFRSLNGVSRNYLGRLNNDASLDASFTAQIVIQGRDVINPSRVLTGQSPTVEAIAPQLDGKMIVGGYVTWDGLARGYLLRLNANGQMDTNFVPTSLPATDYVATNVVITAGTVRDVALLANGKILAGGGFVEIITPGFSRPQRGRIARFLSSGQLDSGFTTGVGANDEVRALALQSDDKIIIGGAFKRYALPDISAPNNRYRLARLNADGSLDETFQPGSGATDVIYAVSWLPSGRVLIGGAFTNYNGTIRPGLARVIAQVVSTNASPDAAVNQGRATLTTGDLSAAHGQFISVLARNPNHATANTLAAASGLGLVPTQPAVRDFLDRVGLSQQGRDPMNWTARMPTNSAGHRLFPAGVTASDLASFASTNVVPALETADAFLANVTDTNFTLRLQPAEAQLFGSLKSMLSFFIPSDPRVARVFLPFATNFTTSGNVTLDYADLIRLRAANAELRLIGRAAAGTDLKWDLSTAPQYYGADGLLNVEKVLVDHPNFLRPTSTNDLVARREAFVQWADLEPQAMTLANSRRDGETHLFNYGVPNEWASLLQLLLPFLKVSLDQPVSLPLGTNAVAYLAPLFSGKFDMRSLLPKFQGSQFVAGSFPDLTMGGLVKGLPMEWFDDLLIDVTGTPAINPAGVALRIRATASGAVISWPVTAQNYVLHSTDRLPSASWQAVMNLPVAVGNEFTIEIKAGAAQRFYRLQRTSN